MLDKDTRKFLQFLLARKPNWVTFMEIVENHFAPTPSQLYHWQKSGYIDSIKKETEFTITPIGESALLLHRTAVNTERRANAALALSVLSLIASIVALLH